MRIGHGLSKSSACVAGKAKGLRRNVVGSVAAVSIMQQIAMIFPVVLDGEGHCSACQLFGQRPSRTTASEVQSGKYLAFNCVLLE